jgi:hypothetical protein
MANRGATKASSTSEAFAAGFAPVAWKSLNAEVWFTKTLPWRSNETDTRASSATSVAAARTSSLPA